MNTNVENLFARIPTGGTHPLYVPNSNTEFRRMVKEANASGRDAIINNGYGYYRVDANNEDDVQAFNEYYEREYARARAMIVKLNAMKRTIEGGRNE